MNKMYQALLAIMLVTPAMAQERIIVQSTTSTANSGLYDHILPGFTEQSGIDVHVVAVGTGQAIRNALNCDGDVLLVHAKPAEEAFVESAGGVARFDLMYNDFVLLGPKADPAGVAGLQDIAKAFARIAKAQARFASRADNSGTHMKERGLWDVSGVDPMSGSGSWYLETGSGMGATMNAGIAMDAYILSDRATWLSFGNRGDHAILVEGDPALFNQYGVIAVNPAKCPQVNASGAERFVDWLLSSEGQASIAEYRVDGEQLFFPNARAPEQ